MIRLSGDHILIQEVEEVPIRQKILWLRTVDLSQF